MYGSFYASKVSGGRKGQIMVTIQESLIKEYGEWLKDYVSLICRFRKRQRDVNEAPDEGKKKHFREKAESVSKNIRQKIAKAETTFKNTPYELTSDQTKELNISIRKKADQGKTPEEILEELTQERAEKSKTAAL